jgi:hypothetical protein
MNLTLIREYYTDKSTIGRLFKGSEFLCYILENPYLGNMRNVSCIPTGVYDWVIRTDSPKYKYPHPHILNVPNRNWILMHIGNYPKDTLGCMLPGLVRGDDVVWSSKDAFKVVMDAIGNAKKGSLTIKDKLA